MPPSDPHSPHSDSSIMDLLHACPETSRFHDFIKKDKEIYDYLNDRKSNVTVFAPTNKAFELLDRCSKGHDIPPELLKRVLLYHMVEGTHGSQDLRYHNTIATKLSEDKLGGGHHQRLRIGLSHDGPTLNFYAVFKMFDSFVDNGVVHAIDSILLPPPSVIDILQYLPTEFSTTETAFHRTGLLHELSKKSLTDDDDNGTPFTLFAPSNRDWQKLGFAANAFLFSDWGLPYLKAIMKYHIVPGELLYSDAWIKGRHHHHSNGPNTAYDDRGDSSGNRGHNSDILNPVVPEEMLKGWGELRKRDERDDAHGLLHGYSHVQLPTLLKERTLSVDVTRLERFLSFRVNGLTSVVISDAPARNGVLQVPDHVLIPPHSLEEHHDPPEMAEEEVEAWKRGEMPVTLLKAILEPWVEE
ncbi:FAS1 domain-containing protein [Ascodesmis nigricans]|uniref:FAS1 domain-containing protein n=1 Tax=Ascodesmis nigricans TaxID=341454 RepID=A0A4S2N1M5_9PEZI|nr:FAS1 domain-containing protein [Ascodesmis nigricans]